MRSSRSRPPVILAVAVALGAGALACAPSARTAPDPGVTPAGASLEVPGVAPEDGARLAEHEAKMVAGLDPDRLAGTVRTLADRPRPVGSDAVAEAVRAIRSRLQDAGLAVETRAHEVEMPVPVSVTLTAVDGHGGETPLLVRSGGEAIDAFLAGTPAGDVEADLVWARNGTDDDWAALAAAGVSARSRVVLVRSGILSHRELALRAFRAGAAAVLIGPRPAAADRVLPYPDGPGRSADAVAGGTLYAEAHGAQARGRRRRQALHAASRLGTAVPIPVWPVDETTVRALLADLGGTEVPESWRSDGAVARHLGPGPVRARLTVDVASRTLPVRSVIATLPGTDRGDESVLVSARLDAWGPGAGAGATAVAALLEVADGLGALSRDGWQPRRTLILAFFDGGTLGRLGAREWLATRERNARPPVTALEIGPRLGSPDLRVGASETLRTLAGTIAGGGAATGDDVPRGAPTGRGDAGALLDLAVPVLEIAAPLGDDVAGTGDDTPDRLRRFADPDLDGARGAARLAGRLVLHLSGAVWPPAQHAVAATRYLTVLQDVAEVADGRFDDNPPPFRSTRTALVAYRRAAEDWHATADLWLTTVRAVPRRDEIEAGRRHGVRGRSGRIDDAGELGARLHRAADAAVAADRAFHDLAGSDDASSCRSLLYCIDPRLDEAGKLFTSLRDAIESGDRGATTAELLLLAAAAEAAATRLAVARHALTAPVEDLQPAAPGSGDSP